LDFFRERIRVLHAFYIATRTRIAVPKPRATHSITGLKNADAHALKAQTMQHVQACKTSAYNNRIVRITLQLIVSFHGTSKMMNKSFETRMNA
jgi:ribosomal protein L32